MPLYGYIMVGLIILSTGMTFGKIGQHRDPITAFEAWIIAAVNGVFIWGLFELAEAC